MATSGSKPPSLPPLPTNIDPQLRNYLKQVDTHLKMRAGDAGNPKDRTITLRDLEDNGIVVPKGTVNDFSITAGVPQSKFEPPDQLIIEQVGEENTFKKFSKTAIILTKDFGYSPTSGQFVSHPSALFSVPNHNFLTQGSFYANHTRGTHNGFDVRTSQYVAGTFDFTTAKHSRGGKKPYLITATARRYGTLPIPSGSNVGYTGTTNYHWTDTIALMLHGDNVGTILPSNNSHQGNMELYNTTSGTFLQVNEGEKQFSNFRLGSAVTLNPMMLQFVSELRSETKYRLDMGALTTNVLSPHFNALIYTVQGLTT